MINALVTLAISLHEVKFETCYTTNINSQEYCYRSNLLEYSYDYTTETILNELYKDDIIIDTNDLIYVTTTKTTIIK